MNPPPPWAPADPTNTGLDGKFQQINQPQNPGVKFMIQACCLAANYCAANEQEGVWFYADVSVKTPNGWFSYGVGGAKCPAKCHSQTFTVTPSQGQNWGGHATKVKITVEVRCTCCIAGGSIVIHDPEYPDHTYDPEELDP